MYGLKYDNNSVCVCVSNNCKNQDKISTLLLLWHHSETSVENGHIILSYNTWH